MREFARKLGTYLHRHRPDMVTTYADGRPQEARCQCGLDMGSRTPKPYAIEAHQPPWRIRHAVYHDTP